MRCLLLRFTIPLLLLLAACDVRDYSGQFNEVPASVASLSAESIPQALPNVYKVHLSWTGLTPTFAPIYRSESNGPLVPIGRGSLETGSYYDEDVLPGKTYEYAFSSAPDASPRASVTIPVDFVAGASDVRWLSGVIKGYRRLFLSSLTTAGPVDIDVDEIVLWQPALGGASLIVTSYNDKTMTGRSAQDVRIKARRLAGGPLLFISVKGESGGSREVGGGQSGEVQIEIAEPTSVVVAVSSGRSRNGADLARVDVPKSNLGKLGDISVKVAGQHILNFDEKRHPLRQTGIYQNLPPRFLSTDGYIYQLELDDDVQPAVFRRLSRDYLFEQFEISSTENLKSRHLIANQRPIVAEVLSGSWKDLYFLNYELANIYNGLNHEIEIEVDVPEVFSSDIRERVENLRTLVKSIDDLKSFVQKNKIKKLVYSFSEGPSNAEAGVLTIRGEELNLDE